MGAIFGHFPNNGINLYYNPDETPDPFKVPENNPHFGFPKERKRKCSPATLEQCLSAKIPPEQRNYCAHFLLKFMTCRKDQWPFPVFCSHEKHVYLNCIYEDYIERMKEYERERRLKIRRKKLGLDDCVAPAATKDDEEDSCAAKEPIKEEEIKEEIPEEAIEEAAEIIEEEGEPVVEKKKGSCPPRRTRKTMA